MDQDLCFYALKTSIFPLLQLDHSVGRDLLLQSQQGSDNYDSKQTSASGGISVAVTGGGSANLSMSQDKLHSIYDSV
nr:hypothetical protein [Yersinia alsatica]